MKDLSKLIICIIAIATAGILTAAAQDTQQYDFSTASTDWNWTDTTLGNNLLTLWEYLTKRMT